MPHFEMTINYIIRLGNGGASENIKKPFRRSVAIAKGFYSNYLIRNGRYRIPNESIQVEWLLHFNSITNLEQWNVNQSKPSKHDTLQF